MPNGGGRPALDPEPPPLDPREKDVPKSFRIPSAEGRGAMSRDAGKAEPCKCPECGGPATRRYMSSHPFGAGTGYYEYKAKPCACGGEKPLVEVEADVLPLTHGRYRLYLLGTQVSTGEFKELDVVDGKLKPVRVIILPEVRGSEA